MGSTQSKYKLDIEPPITLHLTDRQTNVSAYDK